MADSDEEGDGRKSRDKFKRERSDYGDKSRKEITYRDDNPRRRSRDYRGEGSRSDFSPPQKRIRRDNSWDNFGGYEQMARVSPWGSREPPQQQQPSGNAIMSFKQFLAQQDDNIDDMEAVQKYAEYKKDVKRRQLQLFFDKHKEEEWFRLKYHPIMKVERETQVTEDFKARHEAFTTLLDLGLVRKVPICVNVSKHVTKVMDSAVILMEGGNDDDLKVLDAATENKHGKPRNISESDKAEPEDDKQLQKYDLEAAVPEEAEEKVKEDKENKPDEQEEQKEIDQTEDNDQTKENDPTKENDANEESHLQEDDVKEENDTNEEQKSEAEEKTEEVNENSDNDEMEKMEAPKEEEKTAEEEAPATAMEEDGTPKAENDEEANENTTKTTTTETEVATPTSPAAPRPLHLTKSVYIRHISPMVKSSDILEVCQQLPGYLRIAMDGPDVEKGYELRGWVTFSNDANIREVISQLCSIKNSQLTCMANRDLTRRVKHMSSDAYPYHKDVVCNDIQLACQLIKHLDYKHHLFEPDSQGNPLIEEAQNVLANAASSSENKEKSEDGEQEEEEEGSVHDDSDRWTEEGDSLLQVNDCLLWYLRVVHSVDYYGGNMIMQEHRMPHRCGIVTARPIKPDIISVQPDEVGIYLESAKNKIQPHMEQTELLSDQEAAELGKKDVDSEIEKFISDNTKEISKEKYLCPLSGKKFRGPEFVRKHIHNKHASKLEQVKQEVEFYHNYLYDPKRPMPLDSELASEEHQDNSSFHVQPPPDFVPWGNPHMMMFRRGMFPQRGFDMFPFRGRTRRRGGRGRRMVEYHDLDAPADMEF